MLSYSKLPWLEVLKKGKTDEMEFTLEHLWIWHRFSLDVDCSFYLVDWHSCLNSSCDNQLILVHLGIIVNYCLDGCFLGWWSRFVKSQASNYGVRRCMRNTLMMASKLLNGTSTMVTKKVSEWVKSLKVWQMMF
jgi:hypothetical protein